MQTTKQLTCQKCNKIYPRTASQLASARSRGVKNNFCGTQCKLDFSRLRESVTCTNCLVPFEKFPSQMRSPNSFCSSSCAARYNNRHRKYGQRRSKFERWMETRFAEVFPELEIHFNRKDTIESELDVYIPSLRLAIEFNGPQHYKPIFGDEAFANTQANDALKRKVCAEKGIRLVELDMSDLTSIKNYKLEKYVKETLKTVEEEIKKQAVN